MGGVCANGPCSPHHAVPSLGGGGAGHRLVWSGVGMASSRGRGGEDYVTPALSRHELSRRRLRSLLCALSL